MNRIIIGSVLSLCSYVLFTPQQRPEVDLSNFVVPEPPIVQDLSQAIQDVRQISQHSDEQGKLGWGEAADALKQLKQSISEQSRELGEMRSQLVSNDVLEEKLADQRTYYVSKIQEVKGEVEAKLSSSGECNCGCREKLVALEARLSALEAKCNGMSLSSVAPVATSAPAFTSSYPSVASPVVRSGGSNGSPVQTSYSQPTVSYSAPVQTSYSQQVVSVPSVQTVQYCEPTVSYSEPTVSYSAPTVSYSTSAPVVSQSYYPASTSSAPGGGCTGSLSSRVAPAVSYYQPTVSYSAPVVSTQMLSAAPVAAAGPLRTKEVRVIEPRERRHVTTMQVPDTQTSVSVSQSVPVQGPAVSCVDANGNPVPCNQAAQALQAPAVRLGGADGRVFTPFR